MANIKGNMVTPRSQLTTTNTRGRSLLRQVGRAPDAPGPFVAKTWLEECVSTRPATRTVSGIAPYWGVASSIPQQMPLQCCEAQKVVAIAAPEAPR